MMLEPIAIIGQGCVLPGALTPEELWTGIIDRCDFLSEPDKEAWRISRPLAEVDADGSLWSLRGGYVKGFEAVFDPEGYAVGKDELLKLDRIVHWMLYAAKEALRSAGYGSLEALEGCGAVVGNLSLPTVSFAKYGEWAWLNQQSGDVVSAADIARVVGVPPDAMNRFMSGYPAHIMAKALKLGAGAYSIDAACASSLYAIKLACDRLQDGSSDLMLAGAVSGPDPLFYHTGFRTLKALSQTGKSLPFQAEASGLVPAEGCGFVVLKRLSDAERAGDNILGVIKGIGLSNDGRNSGLLSPSVAGQVMAMRQAFERSGLSPQDISLIECHATGTQLGDTTEIHSMQEVYTGMQDLPIGSLKSNMGHLTTAAGIAGLFKVLGAMQHQVRPPTLVAGPLIKALAGSPFRLLTKEEPWSCEGPRLAAISGFGFGGNNAHLIVEQYTATANTKAAQRRKQRPKRLDVKAVRGELAIVGIGAVVANGNDTRDFSASLFGLDRTKIRRGQESVIGKTEQVSLSIGDTSTPPSDLVKTLPQQLQILKAAKEAVAEAGPIPSERTGIFVGMQCDGVLSRHGGRLRIEDWYKVWSEAASDPLVNADWLRTAREQWFPSLDPATVVGLLPNIPANRLNKQFKVSGPGYTVSSEELSGITALAIASRALRSNELDAAIVGAVDMSCELIHETATSALGELAPQGDAAVVMVLKRLEDAEKDGNTIYAILPGEAEASKEPLLQLGSNAGSIRLDKRFGKAHAADGLLHVAAGALAIHHKMLPALKDHRPRPWVTEAVKTARISVKALGDVSAAVDLVEYRDEQKSKPAIIAEVPRYRVFSGTSRAEVLEALLEGKEGSGGPSRLAIVYTGKDDWKERKSAAIEWMQSTNIPNPTVYNGKDIYYRDQPIAGELAFVFAGAATAYQGMGGELQAILPELSAAVLTRFKEAEQAAAWLYGEQTADATGPLQLLGASSFICQLHAEFSRHWLGLKPQSVLGLSSGETNALAAMGAWPNLNGLFEELHDKGIYDHKLAGTFEVLKQAWKVDSPQWSNWRIMMPVNVVRDAILSEDKVYLTVIHTLDDCVIGGDPDACQRVMRKLGTAKVYPLGYDMVIHCPEMNIISAEWREIHRRPTGELPGIRFYTSSTHSYYYPDTDKAAEALLGMAGGMIDFPKLIQNAWNDGARIFVEHGPRDLCSQWIRRILGDQEHVCIALDQPGESSLKQAVTAAAQLAVAGAVLDDSKLLSRLDERSAGTKMKQSGTAANLHRCIVPAHMAAVRLPPIHHMRAGTKIETLLPAPVQPEPSVVPMTTLHPRDAIAKENPLNNSNADLIRSAISSHYTDIARVHKQYLHNQYEFQKYVMNMLEQTKLTMMEHAASAQPSLVADIREPSAPIATLAAEIPPLTTAVQTTRHNPIAAAAETATKVTDITIGMNTTTATNVTNATNATNDTNVSILANATNGAIDSSDASGIASASVLLRTPSGPSFTRAQLEELASGQISAVFGLLFAGQDPFNRQVRMPEPPLLLADRITGIEGEPYSMGLGTLWSETDVHRDLWYMHKGRMPIGIMIESGQADLLLISWLGIDQFNRGEKVYRLLGCELTLHGRLPQHGDTLTYQIQVDSHAKSGDIRLFFFHYDCFIGTEHRITMRKGHAGFFSDEELAHSGGVIWDAASVEPSLGGPLDPPAVDRMRSSFSTEQVKAFSEGRVVECFGAGYEWTETHTSTPTIQSGQMLLLDEVIALDPAGGPWGRGYLRAETAIAGDEWFFPCHFHEDPVMPGTLMFEGSVQAMSFYLTAMGYTLKKDGWQFEPVQDVPYKMECRGQVTPASRKLIYEVFVEEITAGPVPMMFADVLVTVDGLKAFHCRRLGVQLTPDYPLSAMPELLAAASQAGVAVRTKDGFEFNHASLLSCALGKPSDGFGKFYESYDGGKHSLRLPGPPYHFMTRVVSIEGEIGVPAVGSTVEAEYDIPQDAWYFAENGNKTMPYSVLMEVALQPCGWLVSYLGIPESREKDMYFRNLDGCGTMHREIGPDSGTLRTKVIMTKVSRMGYTYIEGFKVECFLANSDQAVYTLDTVFGHFTQEDLGKQVGIARTVDELEQLVQPSDFIVMLKEEPSRYYGGGLRLPRGKLLLLDQVSGYWPQGGKKGLGRLRAEKQVLPGEWFFKAHFCTDPVQPGSLGVESMLQLVQFYMLHSEMGEGLQHPRFEPIMLGDQVTWKYRGQVTPLNKVVTTEVEILEVGAGEDGPYVIAEAWLIVDGLTIYHAPLIGMRIVSDGKNHKLQERSAVQVKEMVLEPTAQHAWLQDHCPTYTDPALPATFMIEYMASAVLERSPGLVISAIMNVRFMRWIVCRTAQELKIEIRESEGISNSYDVVLQFWREASLSGLARFEEAASGRFLLREQYDDHVPDRLDELQEPAERTDPYAAGDLFHGPSFHIVKKLIHGINGGTGILSADSPIIPTGRLHPLLLDGMTHVIPHDALSQWSADISDADVGYPYRIKEARFYSASPQTGEVRCEVRFAGFEGSLRFPAFHIQLFSGSQLWVDLTLVEVLLPKGRLGAGNPLDRKAFLQDKTFVSGFGLSRMDGTATSVSDAEMKQSDWFPGTVASVYGLENGAQSTAADVAIKDHVAQLAKVHPSLITIGSDALSAYSQTRPYERYTVQVNRADEEVRVITGGEVAMDLTRAKQFWRSRTQVGSWFMEDLYEGLIRKFVRHFVIEAPEKLKDLKGRPVLLLANHQTAVESLLFAYLAAACLNTPIRAIAKKEHRNSWIGSLLAHAAAYPNIRFDSPMVFFDRDDQQSMLTIAEELLSSMKGDPVSLLVHIEGTRSLQSGVPVSTMSSLWIDLAMKGNLPIIPVRLSGGLSSEPAAQRLEFPLGMGSQDYVLGTPVLPEQLQHLSLVDRKNYILAAINVTGVPAEQEVPHAGNVSFQDAAREWSQKKQISNEHAVLMQALSELPGRSEETELILAGIEQVQAGRHGVHGDWLTSMANSLYEHSDPERAIEQGEAKR
ncbi:beta-ketoacyl synthase N-terminal-like domain-containing protein [Paenibacillus eucommiae]|uniref:Acyl transferase domain-containing protein/3-hydroxymyristoyl/3-hydroxydecanoyl-(Acyl carrier protein) dehydratase/1-acyl-sn-glycerol-3-phosphate acyltransferase n=1 Tax=Paenibacillus eucommiae TaxID=1355755 RepID=A0ABS4IVQ1_9BACL|nr:beta-ketoacyl synthase N-terminal-like domain-containing protein [Paenibacillus eucommiae]MBP1991652.1 acyl transferase domain-containing protein/3-hydroxymyristoyl/3-hydroxydecanoyl-(acyl carrier protein) dehydratase/1-acyl-sn-glycerol-3-phosphate acyltransferase [Paenibacillus eucommiae]